MNSNLQIGEITHALGLLPPEKITAVKDYVDFLSARYGTRSTIDESDEWTAEDLRNFAAASASHRETVVPWEEIEGGVPKDAQEDSGK